MHGLSLKSLSTRVAERRMLGEEPASDGTARADAASGAGWRSIQHRVKVEVHIWHRPQSHCAPNPNPAQVRLH